MSRPPSVSADSDPTVYVDGVIVDQAGDPWEPVFPFGPVGFPSGPNGAPDPSGTGRSTLPLLPFSGVPFFDPCSVDDVFEVTPLTSDKGGWRAVSYANFANYVTGVTRESAIADTTVQRTLADSSSMSGNVYHAGSLRMYVSVERVGEHSLLSTDGVHFEVEGPRLVPGEGQAESYWDGAAVWMYYNDGLFTPPGVCVKRSADGLDFEIDPETGYAAGVSTGLTLDGQGLRAGSMLTGLSVVKTSLSHAYRGYFGYEPSAPDAGAIYAAYSDDLLVWTTEPDTLSPHGLVIGTDPTDPASPARREPGKQPFALKRHDPDHPDAVTLFYYRPFLEKGGSQIYYCTALDGLSFHAADEKCLDGLGDGIVISDGAVAGPTLTTVKGLHGWRMATDGTYLLYLDTVLAESDGTRSKFIQAVAFRKRP